MPELAFISPRWLDLLDILIVAILLYQLYNLTKGTAAIRIFAGIITIIGIWKLTEVLQMELISLLLGKFIGIGAIAVIIIFQPELRKFLLKIGSNNLFREYLSNSGLWRKKEFDEQQQLNLQIIANACISLSKTKTGALIVFQRKIDLDHYINTGRKLDAEISKDLIENIFFKNSPLHDGALIIVNDQLKAASCLLPVSDNQTIDSHYGLRHRAALGLSEVSDAISIVISEETGNISVVSEGKISHVEANINLTQKIREAF